MTSSIAFLSAADNFVSITHRIWTIRVHASGHHIVAQIEGEGCVVRVEGMRQTVFWNDCGQAKPFLVLEGKEGRLTTMGGHVCPIYARQMGGAMWFSNVASRLMGPGDMLTIDAFVLLQNLTGISYPRNNIFKNIELLEASGEYRLSVDGIERVGSVLAKSDVMSADDVLDIALDQWDEHLSTGADIAVLLSGGYDSRLNLAIACDAAKRYGNRVHAFHEHKDSVEESIAVAVAAAADVPLTIYDRTTFVGADRPIILDPVYIDLQSGFYRENLMRWHAYLTHIRCVMPGCVIMGLGAEAHKGKYYRKVKSIAKDISSVFGVNPIMVTTIGKKMGMNHRDQDSQERYFEVLSSRAAGFESFSSQVDYVHYQTYITHGYGHRCHDLQQHFGIPFPFLDNTFLAAVFNLPQEAKEGFALVTRGINRLMPALINIPYKSANEKALDTAKSLSVTLVMRKLIRLLGPVYYDWFPPRRKGRIGMTIAETNALESIVPRSALTHLLVDQALRGAERVPFLHLDYLIQACLYLDQLERRIGVVCNIEGDRG